jgi:rubrerythrin
MIIEEMEMYDTEELEMYMDEAKDQYRRLEDIAEMAENPQEKNNLMKIAEREKEHCRIIKEIIEK